MNNSIESKKDIKVISQSILSQKKSIILGKDIGKYKILEFDKKILFENKAYLSLLEITSRQLKLLMSFCGYSKEEQVVVAGLGNPDIIADSLGAKTIRYISRMNNIVQCNGISLIVPDIKEKTGVESSDIIKDVCKRVNAKLVVVVDSFSTEVESRIASSVQLSTAGVKPGAGVGSSKKEINLKQLDLPCISVGVPLMCVKNSQSSTYITTLANIDLVCDKCAKLISEALAISLYGKNILC